MVAGTGTAHRHSVLVLEDIADSREALKLLLESQGYRVAAAANGSEALRTMQTFRPCVAIADIIMPTMDGLSFRQEMLKCADIAFRSTSIDGSRVQGELTIGSTTKPIEFELEADGGSVSATIAVTQSKWGMKPYSALFGALKVHDDVVVALQSR